MRIRTFHAANMAAALGQVRSALGDDAVIVSSLEEQGGVRVMAAAERPEPEIEVAEEPSDPDSVVRRALDYHGVPTDISDRLMRALRDVDASAPDLRLAAAFDSHFRFVPVTSRDHRRPMMFVGPPGAGKTTTVAKLAARFALKGTPVSVISLDTVRAAGVEELAAFTRLLGLDLRTATSPTELKAARADCLAGYPVLIDTAGLNPFDDAEVREWQGYRDAVDAEVVLVLAAGLDASEAREIAEACRPLAPSRLITTRIDAARRLGGMLAAASVADAGLADIGHAPRIADGISPINPVSMARLIVRDPLALSSRLAE